MVLIPGSRLGPYEILAPIGAGGMGEVYRARDPRLARDVALKIVSGADSSDADRIRRFEQEAKAVAALNHPHILAVHDVGSENGLAYVVFELLEGQTLRKRLTRGPIPARKAVEYGVQVGRGLAAAHSRGILHRDLKPENLFLTSDGQVKILDFGLAKLTESGAGDVEAAVTRTNPGAVVGTAGYMSPEQARGKRSDARSDVFAFGAILYEMLAGRRAFTGETAADRMSAVLHYDPPDFASAAHEPVPSGLERIVRRCLEKDPEERFQTARDVAFALEALGGASSREAGAAFPRSWTGRKLRLAAGAVIVAGIAAAAFVAGKSMLGRPAITTKQLTFGRGAVSGARFTSDERTVVYSASWDGKPNEIFATRMDSPDSRSLGLPPAKLLSVSSRGELAILLTQPGEVGDPFVGTLARVPLAGGAPRPVLEDVEDADWSPDGQDLALVRRVGGASQLEYPLGRVLWGPMPSSTSSHGLRVSPRGDRVALSMGGALVVVGKDGGRQSFDLPWVLATGLAWTQAGDGVLVTGGPGTDAFSIWRFSLDGSHREVFQAPGVYVLHDVAKSGAALLHHGSEHNGIRVKPRNEAERELGGVGNWYAVDISADGTHVVAIDGRSIYLCPIRGGEPLRLFHLSAYWWEGVHLSPDGQWLLGGPFGSEDTPQLIPTGAGEPRRLPVGNLHNAVGSFLDAGHIYWGALEPGAASSRGFVQDIASGAMRPVTPEGVDAVMGSPVVDGAVLGRRPDGLLIWCPLAGGEPRPTAGHLASGWGHLRTTQDGRWTFAAELGSVPTRIYRIDLTTGRHEVWKMLGPPDLAGVVFMFPFIPMTSDGEAYAYTYLRVSQDLYWVDGLR